MHVSLLACCLDFLVCLSTNGSIFNEQNHSIKKIIYFVVYGMSTKSPVVEKKKEEAVLSQIDCSAQ